MTTQTPAPESTGAKKDVVPSQYREKYKATGGTTGDFVGVQLQTIGKDGLPALYAVMAENAIPQTRWASLNPGQQRMNLSNVLRSRLFKGEDINILGKQFNINHMRADYNGKIDKDKPETIAKFLAAHDMKSDERTVTIVTRTFFPTNTAADREAAKLLRDEQAANKKLAKEQEKAAAKAKRDTEKAAAKAAKPAKEPKPKAPAKPKAEKAAAPAKAG